MKTPKPPPQPSFLPSKHIFCAVFHSVFAKIRCKMQVPRMLCAPSGPSSFLQLFQSPLPRCNTAPRWPCLLHLGHCPFENRSCPLCCVFAITLCTLNFTSYGPCKSAYGYRAHATVSSMDELTMVFGICLCLGEQYDQPLPSPFPVTIASLSTFSYNRSGDLFT